MFHLWERLPTELKLAILKAAVLQARPVTHVHHAIALDGDLGALIGTQNKEVVELALAAYHANNTFHLQVERVGFSSILRLMRPQAQYARMIQHLQFSIDLKIPKQDTEVIFFDSRSPWTFAFVPPADLENPLPCDHDTPIDAKFLAQRFRMHHDFSKLRSLKIYITAELPSDVTFYDFVRNRGRIERVCLCKGKAETLRTLGVGHLGFHTRSASLQLKLHCKNGACEERVGAVLRAILLRGA